ncbi:MAG: DUF1501 domain-containing protein [Planctomycetes bacterium]|nr:DUF1501 domain-containing protein [Planctomycetota bacterium]
MKMKSLQQGYGSASGLAGLSRRGFLRGVSAAGIGAAGIGSLGLRELVALRAEDLQKKGMSVIVLWMQGGPSQFETFDPKPGHDSGGPTEAIKTSVEGIHVAQHWPLVAEQMKDIALIRSMTNREGNHQRATYQLHTGYAPTGSVKHPSFGSLVSKEIGDADNELPQFVAIGSSRGLSGISAGFLGVGYDPFSVSSPERPPDNTKLAVEPGRLGRAIGLLNELEGEFSRAGAADRVREHRALYAKAKRLATSKSLEAFNISRESEKTRELYGDDSFGKGCLLARRLVEAGVTYIEGRSNGWDTHNDNFERIKTLAGGVDRGYAALIADLRDRGMLDRTMVLWMGEFGRTPRVNGRTGRDHYPRVFNLAISGGGVKGGQVIGSSTEDGSRVKDRPVKVEDLFSSVCYALDVDTDKEHNSPLGRPLKIVDGGETVTELFS